MKKVISIKEPWASLIKEKIKTIETRSWRTSYRGPIYIHVSKRMLTKQEYINYKEQLSLLKDIHFQYGCIIAKCNIIDCQYMDEEFIKNIQKNHSEYICGEYKVGRYAWILDNVETLNQPIMVKGQLGLWNFNEEMKD